MVWVLEGLDGFNVEDHALRGFRAWGYRACMRYISESIPRNHIWLCGCRVQGVVSLNPAPEHPLSSLTYIDRYIGLNDMFCCILC